MTRLLNEDNFVRQRGKLLNDAEFLQFGENRALAKFKIILHLSSKILKAAPDSEVALPGNQLVGGSDLFVVFVQNLNQVNGVQWFFTAHLYVHLMPDGGIWCGRSFCVDVACKCGGCQ